MAIKRETSPACGQAEEGPRPLMKLPVKVKLYKHQIKAVNMALAAFDVMGGDADDSKGLHA